MSEVYVWDIKSTIDLINTYKNYEELWNPGHKDYKNKSVRHIALSEIAKQLTIDKSEIERKFKNVSSHYLRELKKERGSRKGGGPVYKSKWFAYKALEFLNNRPARRRSKSVDENEGEYLTVEVEGDIEGEASQNSEESITENATTYEFDRKRKKIKTEDPLEDEPECVLPTPSTSSRDTSTSFAEYIASKVRNMDKKTKAIVEYEINSIIFKAEMGYYSKMNYDNFD